MSGVCVTKVHVSFQFGITIVQPAEREREREREGEEKHE